MKKSKYKQLKRDSKIPKGNKIKKELREKGKSKFMGYRKDLQSSFNIDVSPEFKQRDRETIKANKERRAKLKINQPVHPESYYKDCYINSKEYKNKDK